MKVLYFDCFNGASGDMILGAFLDAGLPLDALREALGSLAIEGGSVAVDRVLRAGVSAAHFRVVEPAPAAVAAGHAHDEPPVPLPHHHHHDHHGSDHGHAHDRGAGGHAHHHEHPHDHGHTPGHLHPHRSLPEIRALIQGSALSPAGRDRAIALFQRLAEAEAAIHQMPVERVHLHEVGALDSIVDIVGAVFAFEWFGADRVVVSPLNVGGGMVRSAHGVFPVPAPATVRLLGDAPVYSSGVRHELLTPTGALLLTSYADAWGPLPAMRVSATGYGAGTRELPDTPNVLRLLVGEAAVEASLERISVLECEIDDMNPQWFGPLMDALYADGALEVFYAPVQMKKGRPGTLVTVLAPPERRAALSSRLFRETTTIGVRFQDVQRERLDRDVVTVETPYGAVRVKVARRDGEVLNAAPEFEDVARLARERGAAIKDVQAAAVKAYLDRA